MIYILIPSTKERRYRLEKCIDAVKKNTKYPLTICTYENERDCKDVGWVKAVHKLLDGIKDDQLVFILGDDAIVAPDCIDRLADAYYNLPKGDYILQPYEEFHKGELATFPFTTAGILKKYIHKGYKHLWSDTELTLVTKYLKMYGIVKEAKVDHQHFLTNPNLMDKTYEATQALNDEDRALFEERAKHNFYL